jgi:hypothetical protein
MKPVRSSSQEDTAMPKSHIPSAKNAGVQNAICVSLSKVLPQIAESSRGYIAGTPHILHHATAVAWNVNTVKAKDVAYAFGIVKGRVVSAYRVDVPAEEWPVMPAGGAEHTRGRRVIPLTEVDADLWNTAAAWRVQRMNGPVR